MDSYVEIHKHHKGKASDKWESYLPAYDRLFRDLRDKKVRIVEVGVQNGGSLEVLAEYFAKAEKIVGCDINPACANLKYKDPRLSIVVGDANAQDVVSKIAREASPMDIFIDDGSHRSSDIIGSFLNYFPMVVPGGLFVIEDTHALYWDAWEGGILNTRSAQFLFKLLTDVVNFEHWQDDLNLSTLLSSFFQKNEIPAFITEGWVDSVEFLNSMIVLRKAKNATHSKLGSRLIVGSEFVDKSTRLKAAADVNPGQEVRALAQALDHYHGGRYEEAEKLLRSIIRPDFVEAQLTLGNTLLAQGKVDAAVACYEQALRVKPDYEAAADNLRLALWTQHRPQSAEQRTTVSPQSREGFAALTRALDHYQAGRFAEAESLLRTIIRPDFVEAQLSLGNALFAQGKVDEAIACYKQVLRINPNHDMALDNLRIALQAQNKAGRVAESGTAVLQPQEGLGTLAQALEHYQSGRFEEAESLLRSVLRPDFVEAQLSLGNALFAQGKVDEAVACYEQALRVNPNYNMALDNLRMALRSQNMPEDAVQWATMGPRHNYLQPLFWGTRDPAIFSESFHKMFATMPIPGRFGGDNMIVWCRNLSFLDDQALMRSVTKNSGTMIERAIIWRTAVLVWAARNGLRLDGDFVECGTYKGTTARELCDAIDIESTGKKFWLYDVFDWSEQDKHHYLDGLDADLHGKVTRRFADLPSVRIVKGYVPDSFAQGAPKKISLLHLDMNNAPAEIGALEFLWDRVVPGGMVVLDDYGWVQYRPQKVAEDEFFGNRGYSVLELPTGQGIVLK